VMRAHAIARALAMKLSSGSDSQRYSQSHRSISHFESCAVPAE
jgi:hypothetical protein